MYIYIYVAILDRASAAHLEALSALLLPCSCCGDVVGHCDARPAPTLEQIARSAQVAFDGARCLAAGYATVASSAHLEALSASKFVAEQIAGSEASQKAAVLAAGAAGVASLANMEALNAARYATSMETFVRGCDAAAEADRRNRQNWDAAQAGRVMFQGAVHGAVFQGAVHDPLRLFRR